MTDDSFGGKVALVTGGGSGIGRATCLAFAARGCRVAVPDASEAGAEETARRITDGGGEALALRCDVRRADEVQAMIAAVRERFGGLDYLVNNAGIGGMQAPVAEQTEESWRDVLDVNVIGVWLCMRHAIPAMLGAGGGAIVNVSSLSGLVGFPGHSAYAASKHAVVGLTRSAALEYARRGIRVNAVCPGFTRTPMVEDELLGGSAEAEQQLVRRVPLGRLGHPDEIAAAILYLCSDAAAFVIGEALVLDGGTHAI